MIKRVTLATLIIVLALLVLPHNAIAQSALSGDHLRSLAGYAQEGIEAAEENNAAAMQHEYDEIEVVWSSIEDDLRQQNPEAYVKIEAALDAVHAAISAPTVDSAAAIAAFRHFAAEATEYAEVVGDSGGVAAQVQLSTPTELLAALNATSTAIERSDQAEAQALFKQIVRAWPSVEGEIAAKSPAAYTTIEENLAKAYDALNAEQADWASAESAVAAMSATLVPLSKEHVYTLFDAAAIILREGLEALLVVAALLAFLRRSDNQDKQSWIWAGAGIGILASIGTAIALQAVFSRVTAGQNRELIEGVTGLVAAALLFYVSYWLHSKASLHGWQRYINTNTTRALARGNMVSLALLSALAVFREGAETTIFYLGIAPSIAMRDLLGGMAIGTVCLVIAAWLILIAGVRLPIRLFFRLAGLLIFYLGFKFVGAGLHALQIGELLRATPIPQAPTIVSLGIYPTWETLIPQLLLLLIAGGIYLSMVLQDRQDRRVNAPSVA